MIIYSQQIDDEFHRPHIVLQLAIKLSNGPFRLVNVSFGDDV